jgi:hypothetical protein
MSVLGFLCQPNPPSCSTGRYPPDKRPKDCAPSARTVRSAPSESVEGYLAGKFGEALEEVREAMTGLGRSLPLSELAVKAYELYEGFRPEIPPGKKGWGAAGRLHLARIRAMSG